MMEPESVEIMECHENQSRSKKPELIIRVSLSSGSERPHVMHHFPPLDTCDVPSLEHSIATTSSSSLPAEPCMARETRREPSTPQESTVGKPFSLADECVTDRVVRFLCPFEEPCLSQGDIIAQQPKSCEDAWVAGNKQGVRSNAEDYSGSLWLQPVQLCIPDKWEGSPERSSTDTNKKHIQNRCSTLETSKRKSDYIRTLRSQWHSKDSPIPLRSSRSETATNTLPGQIEPSLSSSAYYDSDPEAQPERPRYKKNRPAALNLFCDEGEQLDPQCPPAPRHASNKSGSFFGSPRSVTETPDFNNDDEVKAFIQVSSMSIPSSQLVQIIVS